MFTLIAFPLLSQAVFAFEQGEMPSARFKASFKQEFELHVINIETGVDSMGSNDAASSEMNYALGRLDKSN